MGDLGSEGCENNEKLTIQMLTLHWVAVGSLRHKNTVKVADNISAKRKVRL